MTIAIASKASSQLARPFVGRGSCTLYTGSATLVAGQEFKIETSPAGDELMAVTCPAGKVWAVQVRIELSASDA